MEENQPRQYPTLRSEVSRNWRVKDDTPPVEPQHNRSHSHQKIHSGQSTDSNRLYVGNLLYTAQRTDIEQFFNDNGFAVTQLTMSTDPFTGRNPSYCFVDLESGEECNRATSELNGKELLGRPVKINAGLARKSDEAGTRFKTHGDRRWRAGDMKPSKRLVQLVDISNLFRRLQTKFRPMDKK